MSSPSKTTKTIRNRSHAKNVGFAIYAREGGVADAANESVVSDKAAGGVVEYGFSVMRISVG